MGEEVRAATAAREEGSMDEDASMRKCGGEREREREREMATLTSALSSPALQLPPKPAPWRRSIAPNPRARHRGAKPISCTISEAGKAPADAGAGGKMEDYNTAMKRMMRNPYEYHHDLGMNYAIINDSLIVGSQPQKPEDINHLKVVENVAYILCLQQDDDIEYWGVDFDSIVKRCKELGVRHMRRPAKDFDPDSLRGQLPKAVSSLEWAISEGKGRVYVHCTAGLGRAPAVAIAYMFWFSDMDLNTAYETLTSVRPCGPNKQAIRGATYDLAKSDQWKEPFESLPERAFTNVANWERRLIQDRVRGLRGT